MKILWLTWKDKSHPHAGGAETVNEELAKRLAHDGHEVLFVVGGFSGGAEEKARDGFKIIRVGGWYSVYWYAYRYYKKHLQGWADLVIDEMNTVPFFASFYVSQSVIPAPARNDSRSDSGRKVGIQEKRPKVIMFVHQLCREIWFYQMHFPLNVIGYLLEPIYLWMFRKSRVVTISESTKKDLMRYGFSSDRIQVISQGIDVEPIGSLEDVQKYPEPTALSLGVIREMKRTADQVRAFEIAKRSLPKLKMKIAGVANGAYGEKVLALIEKSPYRNDIEYCGRVSQEKKIELMQKSHCILVTSVKEGWGLIVTEAASQGTPAAVYDVDGLRDSVRDGATGILAKTNTPAGLAEAVVSIFSDTERYDRMRKQGFEWSKEITFEKSYRDFLEAIRKI